MPPYYHPYICELVLCGHPVIRGRVVKYSGVSTQGRFHGNCNTYECCCLLGFTLANEKLSLETGFTLCSYYSKETIMGKLLQFCCLTESKTGCPSCSQSAKKFLTFCGHGCIILNIRCPHFITPSRLGMPIEVKIVYMVLIRCCKSQVPTFGKTCSRKAVLFHHNYSY